MMTEEKFYERAQKFALLKNTDGKYFTYEEYEKLIKPEQTDKNKTLIYLYATDKEGQLSFIEKAKNKGYDVLLMDGHLDMHFLNHLEMKFKDSRFSRVDSDIIDKLIRKEELKATGLSQEEQDELSTIFRSQIAGEAHYLVSFENLGEEESPLIITQSEFTRRMKEMAEIGGGPNFYGGLPDSYSLVVNASHPLVTKVREAREKSLSKKIQDLGEQLAPLLERKKRTREAEGRQERRRDQPGAQGSAGRHPEKDLRERGQEENHPGRIRRQEQAGPPAD